MTLSDYNEACIHEAQCEGTSAPRQDVSLAAVATPASFAVVSSGVSSIISSQKASHSLNAVALSHEHELNDHPNPRVKNSTEHAEHALLLCDTSSEPANKPSAKQPQTSSDEWSNCLVGRWWEVYWDPDRNKDDDLLKKMTTKSLHSSLPFASTTPSPLVPQNIVVEKQPQDSCAESDPQSQEPKRRIQKINVLYTSARLGLSLQQVHFPTSAKVDSVIIDSLKQYRQLKQQLEEVSLSYIIVKNILPDAPNGNLLLVNDIITGINGSSFYSTEFLSQASGGGGDFFNRVVTQIKDSKRPMIVNFERVVKARGDEKTCADLCHMQDTHVGPSMMKSKVAETPSTNVSYNYPKTSEKDLLYPPEPVEDLPHGWISRRIPRFSPNHKAGDVYYFSPITGYKFRSRPEVSRFLECLQQTNGDEEVAIKLFRDENCLKRQNSDIDDLPLTILQQKAQDDHHHRKRRYHVASDDEDYEDAVDWYDAKILSYSNGEFVVYFLGDDEGVTYKMPLTPEVIRPSVRVWGTRCRCLIQHNLDLLNRNNDFESWEKLLRTTLPPSTELLDDTITFADSYTQDIDVANSCNETLTETDDRRKLQEYKRMIAMQLHLAKRLSPAEDGIEDEEDQTSEPGPSLSSFQVTLLCHYLTETHDACKWLLSERITWMILDHLSTSNADVACDASKKKTSKEEILSFLVNGARVLDGLLRANPEPDVTDTHERQCGKKKQRVGSDPVERINTNNAFDELLRNALICDESLAKVLKNVTTKSLEKSKKNCVESIIRSLIDNTYNLIWKPVAHWVETADHIVGENSEHIVSIGDIEKHLEDAETSNALRFADLSPWTLKLVAKLSRAQFFEMETWSAIKACIQLNLSRCSIASSETICISGANDSCFAALERLKREASMHPMLNINPLGRALVTSAGAHIPSPLTRSVIDDAIIIRLWVLDLIHAKLVRERSSFVEDVIRRFSTLPKLPPPPFGGFDSDAQPSSLLVENTKDSITILSANCYSYNHIIGNIGASLRCSINADKENSNESRYIPLRTKSDVASALAELRRLPILSVVEEKLCVRDELINWNSVALDAIRTSTSCKLPYTQIQELYYDFENILGIKSNERAQLCKNLRPNKSVDNEVRLFAMNDAPVICPVSGEWVREQYNKACSWKKRCDTVLSSLELHGFFSQESSAGKVDVGLVNIESINSLCEEHQDSKFASSFPEYDRLSDVSEKIYQWSIKFDQILCDLVPLQERCDRLAALNESRPKGVIVKPTPNTICLWLRVFSWPLKVQEGIKLLTGQFLSWKANHRPESEVREARVVQARRLLKTYLGSLVTEGQIFLLIDTLTPSMNILKDEALEFICGSEVVPAPFKMSEILDSTCHAKIGLNHIFDRKADGAMGSPLFVLRVLFWTNMVNCFLQSLSNAGSDANTDFFEKVNLGNAKLLLSLCPRSSSDAAIGVIEDKSDEESLRAMIRDADELQGRANAILSHASDLLHDNSFSRMNELEVCESGLTSLLLNFKSNLNESLLLRSSGIEVKISQKIDVLRWLLNTMSYPILWNSQCNHTGVIDEKDHRIPLDAVTGLHATIPSKLVYSLTDEVNDAEVGRMVSLVTNLVRRAKQWESSFQSLCESGNSKITELCTIKAIAEASILSVVDLPQEQTVQEIFKAARQMKDSLDSKLFDDGYKGIDVHKEKFPNEKSLVAENGDFLLYRLTGSEMYCKLQQAMKNLKTFSDQLKVTTAEKATYLWILDIYEWVEALNAAVGCKSESMQLVINAENARSLLEQGYDVLHSVADEVKDTLALKQILVRDKVEKYSIVIMKGGATNSPGGTLLRWAALLFESLKADVEREDGWREDAEKAINSFVYYETGGKKISIYMARINGLIAEARDLVVSDNKLVCLLLQIVDKVMKSQILKKRLDDDLETAEIERFNLEMMTYEGPALVDKRYDLLESLVWRASSAAEEKIPGTDPTMVNMDSLFAGDQSIRDKSRNFLQKSLLQGFETFGMEKHIDAQDYCSLLAWDLEQAIFDKFKTDADDIGQSVSNEYREKVRCLRFNLQDPKNPMLCARVLSGQLITQDLIMMSSDELASKELNLFRRQVQEEARKSVVLSGAGECNRQNSVTSGNASACPETIRSESHVIKRSSKQHGANPRGDTPAHISQSFSQRHSGIRTSDVLTAQRVATSPMFSKSYQGLPTPPTPTFVSSSKVEPVITSPRNQEDCDDRTPPLILSNTDTIASSVPGRHIIAQSGNDCFLITVSRLKLSFTTKLFVEQSCPYQIDNFLPSSLVEKGRITLDDFNKFISEKMKSGRWTLVHLKLSSITGEADMHSYKRLYKEYESLDRICMINVTDSTKVFLVTPKFLRVCKCMTGVQNLSKSSTYAVVLTKDSLLK